MKVFISWSGDRSKAVAEVLDEWLQCVLQAIDPWMSSKDIDRGSLWFSELSDQLADTKLGIVCLTQDNKDKPWILFESGALAKGLSSSRVCTFLIDLQPTDVGNPLAQFNHSFPTENGVFDLLRTINSSLGDKCLKESVLEKVFETYWPQFKKGFQNALSCNPQQTPIEPRTEENMLQEVLTSVRRLDRRMREVEIKNENHGVDPFAKDPFSSRPKKTLLGSHFRGEWRSKVVQMVEAGLPRDLIESEMENEVPVDAIRVFLNEIIPEVRPRRATDK